jgi:hypothetical protein
MAQFMGAGDAVLKKRKLFSRSMHGEALFEK